MEVNNFVIFDTDMGSDDAWALLMFIKAETVLKLFKILAITAVAGNTQIGNVTENTIRMLTSVNRMDIPIYKGCPEALIPSNDNETFYGLDGFGDVLPSHPIIIESKIHAVNIMYKLASEYPKQVSFVMAGPLTNLATCIKMHGDFLDKVKDIWIMGGNLHKNRTAEFNFRTDVVATQIVLKGTKVPIHIIPYEPCIEASAGIDLAFRFNYLGSVNSRPINLLNKVEKAIFIPRNKWNVPDSFLAAAFIFHQRIIVESQEYHVGVELCGEDPGQMLRDHSEESNVHVIEKLDADNYKTIIAWTAGVPKRYRNTTLQNRGRIISFKKKVSD